MLIGFLGIGRFVASLLAAAASFVALLRKTASEGSLKSWQTHDNEAIIRSAQEMLLQKYGINHTTIQILPLSACFKGEIFS